MLNIKSIAKPVEAAISIQAVIVKQAGKYFVKSHDRSKNLGGPYKSRGEAESRLAQVEKFKHMKGTGTSEGATKAWESRQRGGGESPKRSGIRNLMSDITDAASELRSNPSLDQSGKDALHGILLKMEQMSYALSKFAVLRHERKKGRL